MFDDKEDRLLVCGEVREVPTYINLMRLRHICNCSENFVWDSSTQAAL